MKKQTKRTFSLHHWCGLIAGIFLLAISVSGVVLLFEDEIDQQVYAPHFRLQEPAKRLQIDQSFKQIRQANPGWEIRIPELPQTATEALKYELRQQTLRKWIFVHPETGAMLHTDHLAEKRLTHTFLLLHYTLFAGTVGKITVLFCGLAFLILTITGLLLYRRSIMKVLLFRQKISFQNRRALFSGLHRVVGVWSLVFNLLMSVSGMWLGYLVVENALKKKEKQIESPAVVASVDGLLEKARLTHPEFEVTYLRFPAKTDGALQLLGHLKTDPVIYGKIYSSLQANYKTGEIEKTDLLRDKPWNLRLAKMLQVLHFGNYAGLGVKILYAFFGLMPGLLSVSGFVIWYCRRQQTAVVKQPKPKIKMAS